MELDSPIQYVKGVGPKLASLLSKKDIRTVEDALYFIPRQYEDRRVVTKISDLAVGMRTTVEAEVVSCRKMGYGRYLKAQAAVKDDTGTLSLFWFHAYPNLFSDF